jgi:hypothetical protein
VNSRTDPADFTVGTRVPTNTILCAVKDEANANTLTAKRGILPTPCAPEANTVACRDAGMVSCMEHASYTSTNLVYWAAPPLYVSIKSRACNWYGKAWGTLYCPVICHEALFRLLSGYGLAHVCEWQLMLKCVLAAMQPSSKALASPAVSLTSTTDHCFPHNQPLTPTNHRHLQQNVID